MRSQRIRSPLTVLHLFSGDLWAGADVMIFNLLARLKENSDLKIIALSLNEGVLTGKLREAGIEIHILPESEGSFPAIFLKALALLRKRNIDVIHSHRYKENFLAFLLAKSIGVKRLAATLHGLPEPAFNGKNGDKAVRLKTRMDYLLLKRYFTSVAAVSREMKAALVRTFGFNPGKVEVIHNGINLPPPVQANDTILGEPFHIGTVGRMFPVKDFNLFLDIAAEITRENVKIRFSILGDGPLRDQLKARAKELMILEQVEFLSPRTDPFPYFRSLDLYLNTSLHEGIPLSVLEAMACGKPVVAPHVGGLPEIITDGREGFLVKKRDPSAFAGPALSLVKDPKLRILMGSNSFKKVQSDFNSGKMAESYCRIYQQPV
ncbi:MAG: glycosyltransferase family 4 protein [Nitrospiria bacterium]